MDSLEHDNFAHTEVAERTARVRELNDRLRVDRMGGQLFVTHGICSLGAPAVPAMIAAVTSFSDFSLDNDPYGQHDFGALEFMGHRICWKIDYWDRQMKYGSPDPSDPSVTSRVLTIMLTSEY